MQVLDLDIRIKSLEEALASSEATLRGEASLAAAKVLFLVLFLNGFFHRNTSITLSLSIQSSYMHMLQLFCSCRGLIGM